MRAVADLLLLQVDRELLHLAEEEAGERRAGVRRTPGRSREQVAEGERAGRRRRLDHVEPLPAQVAPRLEGVPPLQPGQRVGDSVTPVLKSVAVFGGDPSC